MNIPVYFAISPGKRSDFPKDFPAAPAGACFSFPDGRLTGLPEAMEPGDLLVVDDRFPLQGLDTSAAAEAVQQAVLAAKPRAVLLDFDRPDCREGRDLGSLLRMDLGIPVICSANCAEGEGPVFLPAPPLHLPLEEAMTPWKGRELWLELCPQREGLVLDGNGCQRYDLPGAGPPLPYRDRELCCDYDFSVWGDTARFLLDRGQELLPDYCRKAAKLGVSGFVGLYELLGPKCAARLLSL